MKICTADLDTALKWARSAAQAWENMRDSLGAVDSARNTRFNRDVTFEELERRRAKIREAAEENVAAAKSSFYKALSRFRESVIAQTMPDGSNLHVKAREDLELLDRGLVDTPEELERIQRKYMTLINPAMIRAIERYAVARNWKWADSIVDTSLYKAAAERIERMAEDVFGDPESPSAAVLLGIGNAEEFIEFVKGRGGE